MEFNAANLSLIWSIPFIAILLSIALIPLFLPKIWHLHYGKIIAVWTIIFIIPFGFHFGIHSAMTITTHAIIDEFIPFILLLMALFTVSGGIFISSDLQGTPKLNVVLLTIGIILAPIMGTTGAAMLMIRPIIRANKNRKQTVHIIIFFIFLVANIAGGFTPIGDPPLFIGFLKGVSFLWMIKHLFFPVFINTTILLILFYLIDNHYYKNEPILTTKLTKNYSLKIYGKWNILLLVGIIGSVLLSGIWRSDQQFTFLGSHLALQNLIRDALLILIIFISMLITPKQVRAGNEFNWQPIIEIAKLFIGIFITISPVLAILRQGEHGALSSIVSLVKDEYGSPINIYYFWLSGFLSGFLDNAPTYLVFFNLASGEPDLLMTSLKTTLIAISMGSVFMGALTYIGNAPNFMVKSIATQNQINMPSFFGYMKWSIIILIPLFLVDTVIFFIL